jgi:hypothetical protein
MNGVLAHISFPATARLYWLIAPARWAESLFAPTAAGIIFSITPVITGPALMRTS